MSEVSVNEVLKQFESVFGKMPAVRATNGEKTYERGDMKLLEMPFKGDAHNTRTMPGEKEMKLLWKIPDGEHCIRCGEKFSELNVFTPAGWRETKISGLCEKCFDEIFADD